LVFYLLRVFLPFGFHVRTKFAVHNEVVAHINRPLVDWFVAPHSGKDVPFNGAYDIGVLVFVHCVAFSSQARVLDALFAAQVLKPHVLRSVAERVLVYFINHRCVFCRFV
jgi:hypothetical protein